MTPATTTQRQHTKRPGEVIVIASDRVLLAANWLNRSPLSNWCYGIEVNVPTIVPAQALLGADGQIEASDTSHGVLPALVDVADNSARALWRDGKLMPAPKSQLVEMLAQKYAIDGSLASCLYALIEAGWTEQDAVEDLMPVYEQSYAERTARRQSWIARTQSLLEDQKRSAV